MRTNRRAAKDILTLNGKVRLSRNILIPADPESANKLWELHHLKSVVPLDEVFGIDILPFKMSVDLMLECAYWAQNQSSYEAAEQAMKRVHGLKINDDAIRMVANEIGRIVFEEDCRLAESSLADFDACRIPFKRDREGVLYIECDGAALNTRHQNDQGASWRENKLGIVFSTQDIKYYCNARTGVRHHRIERREYVAFIGGVEQFKKHLLNCALKNGYGHYAKVVVLSDGAAWIANMTGEIFSGAQHILDFFHLSENVYDFAKELFDLDEKKYTPWAQRITEMLRQGKADEVLNELDALPPVKERCCFDLAAYIRKHRAHIDYPSYVAQGLFIGSGAIESGNKVVLQKRLKQAGMRWEAQTAQYLLTLKSKQESGLWYSEVVSRVKRYYGLTC